MDLKEAIIHTRQVAEGCGVDSRDCAYQHDKLGDWLEELQAYRVIGSVEEFCALKEAMQKRQEAWHSADTLPDQDGLYWGKKDNTNSMWAVRYNSGVWTLSAYPDTKMKITEWAYWDSFATDDEAT